jgi:hypothetical protein
MSIQPELILDLAHYYNSWFVTVVPVTRPNGQASSGRRARLAIHVILPPAAPLDALVRPRPSLAVQLATTLSCIRIRDTDVYLHIRQRHNAPHQRGRERHWRNDTRLASRPPLHALVRPPERAHPSMSTQ